VVTYRIFAGMRGRTFARIRIDWHTWRRLKAKAALAGKPVEVLAGEILKQWIEKEVDGSG